MSAYNKDFLSALQAIQDACYPYDQLSCSAMVRKALGMCGRITNAEANDSSKLWAIKGYHSLLDDTTRFKKHSASETPQDGWLQWYNYSHVSVYDSKGGKYPNGRWEAAPEDTHPLSENGKTGVGYYPNHNYECASVPLTCYYEILEDGATENKGDNTKMITASKLVEMAIAVAMGKYGSTGYNNTYPHNVGRWDGSKWTFDCLGYVHTMVNGFAGDKTKLGGGATMDDFVNCCDEAATLKSCTTYGGFDGSALKKGELLQSSGHVGLYIGEYKVTRSNGNVDVYNTAECTTAWGGGVLLSWTDIANGKRYNKQYGEYRSTWDYHGQLSRVDYSDASSSSGGSTGSTTSDTTTTDGGVTLEAAERVTVALAIIKGTDGWAGVNGTARVEKLTTLYSATEARKIQNIINQAFA